MCTLEKRGRIYLLTLTGDGEHRLSPNLLDAILSALDQVRAAPSGGSALITTGEGKFFSNGFDLNWADLATGVGSDTIENRRRHMVRKLETLMGSLLSLPFPTIAAVSGHAAAAGFMFALCHDYIYMRKDRGFLYMSELDIALTFPETLMTLIRSKIPVPAVRRDVVLRATKFTANMALEAGLIDKALENPVETQAEALRLGEELAGKKWDGNVYANIRMSAFPELAGILGLAGENRTTIASRL